MKIKTNAYTFDASAQTVTFTGSIPTGIDDILAIINATDNIMIFNALDPAKGGTYSSPTVTLDYNTTLMDDGDDLIIYIDDGKGSALKVVTSEFTRPSNTTAYTAKDVISDSTSAPSAKILSDVVERAGYQGEIIKARLRTDSNAFTWRVRMHLYTSAPTQINDNSPFTLLYSTRTTHIGYIDFPAGGTEGSGSDASNSLNDVLGHGFVTGSTNDLWYELETLDAFTPVSAQKFFVELTIRQL